METATIDMERERAAELYREYKQHQHYATGIDREIQRAYRLISLGKVVIRALESIRLAGLGDDGLPKLAIGRADKLVCFCSVLRDGSASFRSERWNRRGLRFVMPPGTFAGGPYKDGQARAPLIPIHLRPQQALDAYHILWEADWTAVPRDPLLLRRIGHADLWLVVAAWDLTDIEVAALSTRVHAD